MTEAGETAGRRLTVSVVVCTHERPDDLVRCLAALAAQVEPPIEVIVVDNAPRTERTRAVCEQAGVRYIQEARKGLDIARNAGAQASTGDIVAYTDDDAIPDADWTRCVREVLEEPNVGGMAGAVQPAELETPAQRLFEEYLLYMAGKRRRDQRREYVLPWPPAFAGHVGAGANMAFPRALLAGVGPFDEAFDAGTETHSGGDTEMFARFIEAGHRLIYEPRASVRHRHRRTLPELRRQLFGYGVGVFAFWTHWWLRTRDRRIPPAAVKYMWWHITRLPNSFSRRNGELPPRLVLAELMGSWWGPVALWQARRRLRRERSAAGNGG